MNKNLTIALVIIAGAVLYGLYLAVPKISALHNSYNELKNSNQQLATLQTDVQTLRDKLLAQENIDKVASKPVFKNELPSDDPMSSFGVMFEDVIQAAKYNKLKLYSIAYDLAPANDVIFKNIESEYNVCEISMQLIGKYPDFSSYIQDIYNYPFLINISKLDIKPYELDKKILIGDFKVVLYSKK